MALHLPTPYRLSRPSPTSPTFTQHLPASRLSVWSAIRYTLLALATISLIHLSLAWLAPEHPYTATIRAKLWDSARVSDDWRPSSEYAANQALPIGIQAQGAFYRDPYPLRTVLSFWDLAEKEVAMRGLDTCDSQLGRPFIEAYHETELPYCVPGGGSSFDRDDGASARNASSSWRPGDNESPPTYITCSAIHRHPFTQWWPYPAAPCLSSNLRMVENDAKAYRAVGCDVTDEGSRLVEEMGREDFTGQHAVRVDPESEEAACRDVIGHTTLLIGRQDQWNPFHVAEDLITTVVTMLLAARNAPDLIDSRLQLIFLEGFGMDQNHFTPLWDRMGAWAPRRLSLDPWGPGICLTNAIHSVGAGASFLSAQGVGNSYQCASTVTWAASHYYRHLFGLLPNSLSSPNTGAEVSPLRQRRPINILWLSRTKLDAYAMKHNDWSKWRGVRHITNEPALMDRIKRGISDFCVDRHGHGACIFEDGQEEPDEWSNTEPLMRNASVPIRFASIDPTVHALETQVQYVGHTTILVSSHGGALGLSLFLPPGNGVVVELQVKEVEGNFHFEHMAYEMGHRYQMLQINRDVNVDMVWRTLEEELERFLD